MNEKELYAKLGALTKDPARWRDSVGSVASLMRGRSSKITGKVLWLLGEIGLQYPDAVLPYVPEIAAFLGTEDAFLRERTVNTLGRIGRVDIELVKPYWQSIFALAADESPNVRLSFIWACENIATNTPDACEKVVPVFEKLLEDENVRVRIEAPEMFRVLGNRKPEYVHHCLDKLTLISERDADKTVRIHAKGAIKAIVMHSESDGPHP